MKRKAIFLLYRILQVNLAPLILLYFVLRGLKDRRYFGTLKERYGGLPPSWQQTVSASIWLHAVSVGEILAAIPLIEELKRRSPETPIFVSTGTLAGRETAAKRLDCPVFYAPFDMVWVIRRVLRKIRPSVVVVMETEIWPNLFHEVNRIGCGLVMVNGRMSDEAFPKYRRFCWFFRGVFEFCDRVLTQSEEMRRRFVAAGAKQAEVGGNLKYDFTPRHLELDMGGPLWIAASTCSDGSIDEEDLVIAAQKQLPGWKVVIAPRQPDRFEAVAKKLDASGLNWARRTDGRPADVLLLDTMGELSGLFDHADAVFMGGTIAAKGGHNILEPAASGKPVIVGPHMENFRDIQEHFREHGALIEITGDGLADAVRTADPEVGARGKVAADLKRGATAKAADAVMELYDSRVPCFRPAQPGYALGFGLALLWRAANAWDRARKRARARKLDIPVVSIGNITVGGTGKTPMTIELLHDFESRKPGVLTRGHGRSTRDIIVLTRAGERPIEVTGDEAQLLAREGHAPVGIGPDRYEAGLHLIAQAHVKMAFLDDGFQHPQLHRDFDLVLIDGLNPFGGGHLLPLGRLREPLEGLARADAFVITRAGLTPNTKAIEAVLRRYNPKAPVFRSRIVARRWVPKMPEGKLVAFCGLGNPESFWRSLKRAGIESLEQHAYDDHHRYTPNELRRLALHAKDIGATGLVTTAKDAVNLDPDYLSIIAPLSMYWLEIGLEIDNRDELARLIEAKL